MSRFTIVILALAVSSACGGEVLQPPTPIGPCMPPECAPVDVRFDGEWEGFATSANPEAVAWAANVRMTAVGNHLSVDGVCPGGDGRIGADGEGGVVDWSGDLRCEQPSNSCPERILWLTAGQMRLTASGVMILLMGQSVACGEYELTSIQLDLSRVSSTP